MEALLLQDGAYVSDRYEELQRQRRQFDRNGRTKLVGESADISAVGSATSGQQLEHCRIVQRAKTLDAKGPTPHLKKKFLVLLEILERLYAENGALLSIISPSDGALKRRLETENAHSPALFKELPVPTQVVLKMFFRTCQSLRDPTKLAANSRLSVQIATKLPSILTTMPSCVLSPGLVEDVPIQLEDGGDVSSVFYQLLRLFEELLGFKSDSSCETKCRLSLSDRATVIVAYVALSLKWGRLGYLLKGVRLLLENANELNETQFGSLGPLFRELAATSVERPQIAFGEEEQPWGYLMSFGKGDHGKLGHGQCVHVSCQEGNCTENKLVPTMIAATRDVLFRKIDSLSTHSIAITATGDAMAWGNGDKYRLGHGSSTKEYTPRTIEYLSLKGRVRDLACGLGHTLALMESGELFAWGNGSNGRLGLGDTNDRSSPTKVVLPTTPQGKETEGGAESSSTNTPVRFRHIFCGASHSLGISWAGRAYAWGKNNQGQCGHGHTADQWTIQDIESFRANEDEEGECITYAAGGWEHTLFCTASGRVYSCGCGYKDSRRAGIPPVLGHGDSDRRLKPTLVQTLDDIREEIVKVACGWDHSLAVSSTGRVYTWGSGTNGKLGHGGEESFDIPTLVRSTEGKRVKDAKAGCEHTVLLTHDHELWTCGQGDSGRLGHGDNQTRKRPTKVELFADCGLKPVALAVGDKYNLVLVRDCDVQYDQEEGGESIFFQKALQRVPSEHTPRNRPTNVCHGQHRTVQQKKLHDSRRIEFGPNWVLSIAQGMNRNGSSSATALSDPDSASSAALFIAGHIDRLATDYLSVKKSKAHSEKQQKQKVSETNLTAPKSVLLPFAADTSYESLTALFQLLRWTISPVSMKEKSLRAESDVSSGICLGAQERMGLALSCLRILQLNLKKALDVCHSPVQSIGEVHDNVLIDLFGQIHELLDTLASLKWEDAVCCFDIGTRRSSGAQNLSDIGSAICHEAACALKVGFGIFYPTGTSRCSLLWKILDNCQVNPPSMRTIIISDQLCKDSIMTEIFTSLPSHGLLSQQKNLPHDIPTESTTGKDIFDFKTLMVVLLKRSSAEAIKHLDNEAFTDFMSEPDCFLRLLHVLQMHYFSIAHHTATGEYQMNGMGAPISSGHGQSTASQQMLESLLEYVDALMAESLAVLKKLHKGSRQHEDIITWRLNGSFFHTLLPSAIECLSLLLAPMPTGENTTEVFRSQTRDNFLLVERILPNLHAMLKMLDEVSWKMHSATDAGNQTHEDNSIRSYQVGYTRNWFIDLGDACAVLCGKLSCDLFYPSRTFHMGSDDVSEHGTYYSLVMSEGRLLREDGVLSATRADRASSSNNILEWERLGVFEVEDELVGGKEDSSVTGAELSCVLENQRFLLQLCDADFSSRPVSFWSFVAARLSHAVDFSIETQRVLTLVVTVLSWHLGLSSELRSVYDLYDIAAHNSTGIDSIVPTGRIWEVLSILLCAVKRRSWVSSSIGADAIANATELSRVLLSLQPNPALVPSSFQCEDEDQHTDPSWESTDESLDDMLEFLTSPVNAKNIQQSFNKKEEEEALVRTGICILHDLLRKLTTSSTKSCLLDEFVAVTCATNRANFLPSVFVRQKLIFARENGKQLEKAIENLFIRMARVVSSEDASFELKKKALMTWTVTLSATKRGAPSVVALIAKSGIMSTLVELLLDEANVLDTHSEINALRQIRSDNYDDKWANMSQSDSKLTTKTARIKALLLDQTPVQILSVLAWEAFCAVAMQLSKSDHFAELRRDLLLRSAGSSLHDREPLTPRSTSMSPRRRLTLPKKMVIASIDEIIEQMTDGLFVMLTGTTTRLDTLELASQDYDMLAESVEQTNDSTEKCVQQQQTCSRVFLFGCPVEISHSNSYDVAIPKSSTGNTSDDTTSLALSFWIYVEQTSAAEISSKIHTSTSSQSKEVSVQLVAFSSGQVTSDSTNIDSDGSMVVFTRDIYPDHVSIGLAMRCNGHSNERWCTILLDEHLPRAKWVQVVMNFDRVRAEPLQVFVGTKRSTFNNGQKSVDCCENFCVEYLHKAASWTRMTAGGNVDLDNLTSVEETSNHEVVRLSVASKKLIHGFAAVLDDVVIAHGALSEERIVRMQHNGPVLVRLKQQHIAETHCVNVLRLLCHLVTTDEATSCDISPARIPFSDRWITLFTHMLLRTCRDQDLAQVYLCSLLQEYLPRAPLLADIDVQILGQKLFAPREMKTTSVEYLFDALNERSQHPSTSTIRRQLDALYRTMHPRGVLHGKYRDDSSSEIDQASDDVTTDLLALRPKASMRFAAVVDLFQTLCRSPSWTSRTDDFIGNSSIIFQRKGGLQELLDSEASSTLQLADMTAIVSTIAGYSEEVVNSHRAAVQDAAILPAIPTYSSTFDSVIQFDDCSVDQIQKVQALVVSMLNEETRETLRLPARKDVLNKCHNDIVAAKAIDQRIGALVYQRTRVLRVLATALLREKLPATKNPWHVFLLNNLAACDDLLQIAASNTKAFVTSMLGPDAKTAMKLRRLRIFIKDVLQLRKHRRRVPLIVSLADLESFQWRLWEERATQAPSISLVPWWQQRSETDENLTLEVVGGDVEVSGLKVKALEHFPTVKLARACLHANSGVWYFEVIILTDGLMQIGYVDGDFTADPLQGQGVGDHTNSWAFDGFRGKKWNVNSFDYGEQWKAGDVVGVLLDTDRMDLSYYLNGKCLGVAFSGIAMTASSRMCPAASLNVHQSVEFNVGIFQGTRCNEEGLQSTTCGLKHLPVLDKEDQTRLRPMIAALQPRGASKADDIANLNSLNKDENKENDASTDWSSSSSEETDEGDIALGGSESLSEFRRPLDCGGCETCTTDGNDEDNGQHRRDLIEGLTGLGFPLDWATRCAAETRLPIDETGAVAWILEQMEKGGLNGSSNTNEDGVDNSDQLTALWSTSMHLPNLVLSQSDEEISARNASPLGRIDGVEMMSSSGLRENQLASFPPSSCSLSLKSDTTSVLNAFIDADKDDQEIDDTVSEAFQSSPYKQRQIGFHIARDLDNLSESDALNKRTVDDLLPLSLAVDTTVFLAYTRQVFTSLLLLALRHEGQEVVYKMVQRVVSSEDSGARLHRFLRVEIGLNTMETAFELGFISENDQSGRSLRLQQALMALFTYEAKTFLERKSLTENSSERCPLLKSFCQEMMNQSDRFLGLMRGKQSGKRVSEPTAIQAAAAWFAWVSALVLGFVEAQISRVHSLSEVKTTSVFAALPFASCAFVENLVAIASSPSSTFKAWKYVAFRLLTRILFVTGENESLSTFCASAQRANVTQLLTLRYRREMDSRCFNSDVTSALFALLVRSARDSGLDKRQQSETQRLSLCVDNYSSTHVTISWDQTLPAALLPASAANSDSLTDEATTENKTEIDSSIVFLYVTRGDPQLPEYLQAENSTRNSPKAVPLKGTFTIRALLPDTRYRIRLEPDQSVNDTTGSVTAEPKSEVGTIQMAEIMVQTRPEPVFELDRETLGKNLVVFNRNLTAKNTVNKKWHSVRASVAFDEGVHTWQVRLDTCVSKNIFIGVCTADASMENYVGSDAYGYGFLANKAIWHNKAKLQSYGEIFKQGDTIQVTLDCNAKTLAFSRNGEYLGIAASNLRAGTSRCGSAGHDGSCKWYPAFSMYNKDDKVTLIPPSAASMFTTKEGRPQNASMIELLETMQDVLAYQSHLVRLDLDKNYSCTKLFEKAFVEFDRWRRDEILFRETSLGQFITIDKSKSATDKYGLAAGDSVFTSKGQCTVLGEYRHELWYEVEEGGSSSLFGTCTRQLASWSLSTCREMVASPDDYPVHHHHKYKLEYNVHTETDSVELHDSPDDTTKQDVFSFKSFVDAQIQWSEDGDAAAAADSQLIAELDALASSQISGNASLLSCTDISTTLLLEKMYEGHGISRSSQIIARIGLLLYVNRCLYHVVRLAFPRNLFATLLEMSENADHYANHQPNLSPTGGNTECQEVPPVAALLNSPLWALDDPSAFIQIPSLAARLLFSSQKEKLIDEELRWTKTASRTFDSLQEPSNNEHVGGDADLPVIKINYPRSPKIPFWECSSAFLRPKRCFDLPLSTESFVFVQLATQLTAQDARQWRRESSQPLEAIPISQTFQVYVEKLSTEAAGEVGNDGEFDENPQQQQDEDEEDQPLQQPSSKQTERYLNLFETAVREIQSPWFPLFAPTQGHGKVSKDELHPSLQLDVNLELFSPRALAHCSVPSFQLLLWYYCVGQLFGMAWRNRLLLPLQFLSNSFWEELVNEREGGSRSRSAALRAIRDGLFSIIPSRCVALLSGSNPSLRERFSDLNVAYITRLERYATYSVPRQKHHDTFWKVVNAFTSIERRMLEQFVNSERRNGTKQVGMTSEAGNSSSFVLEIADALADGRDHPDSCYPVVVPTGPYSSRLHLPAYSSTHTLRHKLLLAMTNIPFM